MSSTSVNNAFRVVPAIAGVSFAFTILTSMTPANAAILTVGAGQTYKTIQGALNAAKGGDTINVKPGTYGCATVTKSNLTIQGTAAGVKMAGAVCGGKALLVVAGTNTTVNNITFAGAKASAGNGAGIRMEGTNLTVLNSAFNNNQNGIMSSYNVKSTIAVKGSTFTNNGTCVGSGGCAHAIYAGHIGTLDIQNSTFTNTKAGHHIKSRANNTVVMNSTIKDTTTGTASYLIDVPNGGAVTITGNYLQKGILSTNPSAAIALGFEAKTNPVGAMLVANNTFQNDLAKTQSFVWNRTGNANLIISDNTLLGLSTVELKGAGTISDTPPPTTVAALRASSNFNDAKANLAAMPVNYAAASQATDVPEPATIWLFGAAILGLGLLGSRRKETD